VKQPTLAALANAAAQRSHAELTNLLMRADLGDGDPGQGAANRLRRATAAMTQANTRGNIAGLVTVAAELLNSGAGANPEASWVQELVRSLRLDGFDAAHVETAPPGYFSNGTYEWTVAPIGTAELPLPAAVNAAVDELRGHSLDVAASHLRQAFDAYGASQLEASNAQSRAVLEAVLVAAAHRSKGWTGTSGGQAIDVLDGAKAFEKGEHDFIKGLWAMSHGNGSHPGLTSEAEAMFRLTVITATARFLMARFW